jgi:hypothetical protein
MASPTTNTLAFAITSLDIVLEMGGGSDMFK